MIEMITSDSEEATCTLTFKLSTFNITSIQGDNICKAVPATTGHIDSW